MTEIPQLALPLRLAGTRLAELEQGSRRDLQQRVAVLCLTPLGWLDNEPGFGLADQTFRKTGPDLPEIERQIATYVPEADALVTEDVSALNEGLARVGVRVGPR